MTDVLSSPAEVSFTNNGELAKNAQATANAAQANAMFYVGNTQPSNPQVGMVWVQINQANNNWLQHGATTNQLTSTTIGKGNWGPQSSDSVYGALGLKSAGTIMTISCWLDLTGETISDLGINMYASKDSHGDQWWINSTSNKTYQNCNITPMQQIKAGTAGWCTVTFKFPRDTELSHMNAYITRSDAQGVATQDIPLKYRSWKLDWDSKRTQWCDGVNTNKGNVDNAQKWDGSKWVPTQFTSDVIADYIYGKSIIGSTFANATGSFKVDANGNINGANVTGSSFNTSTGKVNQYQGDNTPWMPWIWDRSAITIGNGFISTTANNAVAPGQGFTANAVGTYSPAYLKFTMWSTDGKSEYGRSYLDGSGLYVGTGVKKTFVSSGNIGADILSAYTEIDTGNIKINSMHSYYSLDAGDIYFRGGGDQGGVDIHATGFAKISQLSTKTNIHPMDTKSALNTLNNLELTKYKRISKLNIGTVHDEYGGIIDDINDTPQYKFPKELLSADGSSEDDSNLLAFAVASIQELTKLNEQLQFRVALLEAHNGTNSNHAN